MNRVLFICRRREGYDPGEGYQPFASGLRNSVSFAADMLNGLGVPALMVEVEDNSAIDREVTAFQPTHAFIEGLWVVPEKFDELAPLHPHVNWIVRTHSKVPFLSNEGIAMEWVAGYLRRRIEVQCNSARAQHDLRTAAHHYGLTGHLITHLPNYYPTPGAESSEPRPPVEEGALHVGCFGAIRPLKNHLAQAIAAIAVADHLRVNLRFHINSTRIEGNGEPILKNLRAMFANGFRHQLVEHPWVSHADFLGTMGGVDLASQVSLSETFNIVTADAVSCAVPVVASPQVEWLGDYAMADPNNGSSIIEALLRAWARPRAHRLFAQRQDLTRFCTASEDAWGERFA